MTIIAYDTKYLVADGRCLIGTSLISDNVTKLQETIIKELGTCIIGCAGALDMKGPTLDSLAENGLKPVAVDLNKGFGQGIDLDFSLRTLILTPSNELIEFGSDGAYFDFTDRPCCIGSGAYITQHYLLQGYNAVEAIKKTFLTELSCGGNLTIYDIKKRRFVSGI